VSHEAVEQCSLSLAVSVSPLLPTSAQDKVPSSEIEEIQTVDTLPLDTAAAEGAIQTGRVSLKRKRQEEENNSSLMLTL